MLPALKPTSTYGKVVVVNAAQPHVVATHPKLALLEAHRREIIAAAATLVKHEWDVLLAQQVSTTPSAGERN
jgi:hypothetical protein